MDVISQVGIASDIRIRAYITVFAYVNVTFNVNSRTDDASFIQKDFTVDMSSVFNVAFDFSFYLTDQLFINLNQFPRPSDINPVLIGFMTYYLFAVFNLECY